MWYKVPAALPAQDWAAWRKETQAKYPVQYFFRDTMPYWWEYSVWGVIKEAYWAVMHRIHPKHRYHVIKPRSLTPGYHDPDSQIRAAAFDTMSIYAESLMGDGMKGTKWTEEDLPDTDANGRQITLDQIDKEAEIIELRNWWVDYYPRRNAEDVIGEPPPPPEGEDSIVWYLGDKYEGTPEYKAHVEYFKDYTKYEELFALEDEMKFIELIKLLPYMWH